MEMKLDDLIRELSLLRKGNGNLPVVLKQAWESPAVNSVEVVDIPDGSFWSDGRRESSFKKAVGISWILKEKKDA